MPSPVVVRPATRADAPRFLELVDQLAVYEKLTPPAADAKARLVEDAFGNTPRIKVLLGLLADQPVAYAIVLTTYSSFLARPTLYLEDLFVAPDARREGVARAMMRAVAQEALEQGCHRIEGVVLAWNEPAHGFYDATGAKVMKDWWLLRYDRAAVERLATAEDPAAKT